MRHRYGGTDVLRGQLEIILLAGQRQNAEIQVMSTECEENAGVNGPFTVATRKDGKKFVYTETHATSSLETDRDDPIAGSQSARVNEVHRRVAASAMNNAESSTAASGLAWFKSSYSGTEGGQCVEVAAGSAAVRVRDSKTVAGSMLTVSREAWSRFVGPTSSEPHV